MTKIERFILFLFKKETVTKHEVLTVFNQSEVFRVYYDSFRRNGAIDLENKVIKTNIYAAWQKLLEENRERKDAHRKRIRFFKSKNIRSSNPTKKR